MSELRTNRIIPRDGLVSGASGGVIQVVFSSLATGSTVTVNSSSFVDIMSASITPTRSDSKILVMYDLSWSAINGHCSCRLMRDSTPIKVGDASGNKTQVTGQVHYTSGDQYDLEQVSGTHMDTPATTSAVTYSMQIGTPYSASYDCTVNYHSEDGADLAWSGRGASTITVMEISV